MSEPRAAFSEFGDFQTPEQLAREVVATLPATRWGRVLEPTCGKGTFLAAASAALGPVEAMGVEIQAEYAGLARQHAAIVLTADVWTVDLSSELPWKTSGPLLVVGNPPWVTNAELGRRGSANLPRKSNPKALKGLDAMTGSANFDTAEHVWLKVLVELATERPTVAMLCKTQVARSVLRYCHDVGYPVVSATVRRIDAKRWFGAAVDACLFTVVVGPPGVSELDCDVFDTLEAVAPVTTIGFRGGRLVSDVRTYERAAGLDGACPVEWRQGIKHDAAAVMELAVHDGKPHDRDGGAVVIEDTHLYPLLKSTDVYRGRTTSPRRVMVVPQTRLGQDTAGLAVTAPLLWSYLSRHATTLDGRKSSVYQNRPRFCVFGIGAYSFAPFKVVVSGLHKEVAFRAVGPVAGKPVVLDDTCYFLAVDSAEQAAFVLTLLDSEPCRALLSSLVFTDSKRPVTKALLQRIDLVALAEQADVDRLATVAAQHHRTLSAVLGAPVDWTAVRAAMLSSWRADRSTASDRLGDRRVGVSRWARRSAGPAWG